MGASLKLASPGSDNLMGGWSEINSYFYQWEALRDCFDLDAVIEQQALELDLIGSTRRWPAVGNALAPSERQL